MRDSEDTELKPGVGSIIWSGTLGRERVTKSLDCKIELAKGLKGFSSRQVNRRKFGIL